jgi:hypothetical protein
VAGLTARVPLGSSSSDPAVDPATLVSPGRQGTRGGWGLRVRSRLELERQGRWVGARGVGWTGGCRRGGAGLSVLLGASWVAGGGGCQVRWVGVEWSWLVGLVSDYERVFPGVISGYGGRRGFATYLSGLPIHGVSPCCSLPPFPRWCSGLVPLGDVGRMSTVGDAGDSS